MSANGQLIRWIPMQSIAFGSISGTYTAVGVPFPQAARQVILTNTSNANLIVSFDGINNHLLIAATTAMVFDYASNKADPTGILEQRLGTQVYVKEETGAPSSGNLYVSVTYASSN